MKGPALAALQTVAFAFMDANPVQGAERDKRFTGMDFGFDQEIAARVVSYNLAPEQASAGGFIQPGLPDHGCQGQALFYKGTAVPKG